ncbi:MAG TPA: FHA domain-containing protein, partial [Thermoanaerobaculia bacterium]|nr:FHA domain-containing protein [Thermoanaerobaculia bacterium]
LNDFSVSRRHAVLKREPDGWFVYDNQSTNGVKVNNQAVPRSLVEDVQVLRGLPLGLSEAAAEAVRHWHYRPARGRFGPVSAHKTVRIVFTLGQ